MTCPRLASVLAVVAGALMLAGCERSPAAPERSGPVTVTIQCEPGGGRRTACRATVTCGLYGCPAATPPDITTSAVWTIADLAVAQVVAPGQIESVAPGNTVVRASQADIGYNDVPISVFPGTAPLQTFVLSGAVTDASTPARPPLYGVRIEILDGHVAGRTATSGVAPPFMAGYWTATVFGSGEYEFFGVPKGTYRLRASMPGYITQEREVTSGVNAAQFALERAE